MGLKDEIIIGKKYNHLTIIKLLESASGSIHVECKCDCGKVKNFLFTNLKNNISKSCGCYKIKKMSSFK